MTDKPVDLDHRRGVVEQKATDLRRMMAAVQADAKALRERQDELEAHLAAAPAASWIEAAEKARYLLTLFSTTPGGIDPRRQALIDAVLEDFSRLGREG